MDELLPIVDKEPGTSAVNSTTPCSAEGSSANNNVEETEETE